MRRGEPPTGPSERGGTAPDRWREEFPYRYDADALVTRREFLRFAVLTSGTLFAGTLVLAGVGAATDRRRGEPKAIAPVDAIAPGGVLYFNYPGDDDQAVLLNLPDRGLVAYSQKCTHLACGVYFQEEEQRLFCPCHEGVFALETGVPVAGPPQRRLPRIRLDVRDGMVFAVEEVP